MGKWIVAGLMAATAIVIGAVVLASRPAGLPYVTVDDFARDARRWDGRTIQLRGTVEPGSIQRAADTDWRFNLVQAGRSVAVRYVGNVPNTFEDGADVVVNGELEGEAFQARGMMVGIPQPAAN